MVPSGRIFNHLRRDPLACCPTPRSPEVEQVAQPVLLAARAAVASRPVAGLTVPAGTVPPPVVVIVVVAPATILGRQLIAAVAGLRECRRGAGRRRPGQRAVQDLVELAAIPPDA